MLEIIKEGYHNFKEATLLPGIQFPLSIEVEVNSYDTALCSYLKVERQQPQMLEVKKTVEFQQLQKLVCEKKSSTHFHYPTESPRVEQESP